MNKRSVAEKSPLPLSGLPFSGLSGDDSKSPVLPELIQQMKARNVMTRDLDKLRRSATRPDGQELLREKKMSDILVEENRCFFWLVRIDHILRVRRFNTGMRLAAVKHVFDKFNITSREGGRTTVLPIIHLTGKERCSIWP